MFSFVSNILILCLFEYRAIAFTLDCSDPANQCKNTNIECLPNEDCFILCTANSICSSSTFHCPLNGECNIECRGDKACQDTIVNATSSSGHLNIECQESMDHCRRMKVYGSKLEENYGDMQIICNGDLTSCMESEIYCPDNGDCFVSCNADTSCKYAKITGPNNGDLIVNCNGRRSCIGSRFNGLHSMEMEISGCIQYESCLDLSLYCPPNTNRSANCFIQGNDNLGKGDVGSGIEIYAINGWNDIHIDYSGSFDASRHSATMFCGYAYDNQCIVAPDSWRCIDKDNYCENIEIDDPMMQSTDIIISVTDDIYETEETLPDLTRNSFEHGAMGMIIVGGGLIALAFGCVICGTIKKGLHTVARKLSDIVSPQKKGYKGTHGSHHIEEIIDQMEPSYDDNQHHHQSYSQHQIQKQIQMQTLR